MSDSHSLQTNRSQYAAEGAHSLIFAFVKSSNINPNGQNTVYQYSRIMKNQHRGT
jgi:hypothetical protein